MNSVIPQPLIAVTDVESSSRWYQKLLGCESGHGGAEYERIVNRENIVLQLHDWDLEEHPHLGVPGAEQPGNGILLWFQLDNFNAAVERARELNPEFLHEPFTNPYASHREFWVRDPDGYVVVVAGPANVSS